MANHKSSKKRIRQTETRTKVMGDRRARVRTFIKKVEVAIEGGDKTVAQAALKEAQPELMRGSSTGAFHATTISRKISRLSARIKAIA